MHDDARVRPVYALNRRSGGLVWPSGLARSLPRPPLKGGSQVSQQIVGEVMTRLLTDEALRVRFAEDPSTRSPRFTGAARADPDEIDVFVHSDVRVWFGNSVWGEA